MLVFGLTVAAVASGGCPSTYANDRRSSVALLSNPGFPEISGIAVSTQKYKGQQLAWVHNDGGHAKALGLFSVVTGTLLHTFKFASSSSIVFQDPEDLTLGSCGSSFTLGGSGECIYLFDGGDNSARGAGGTSGRANYRFYKFREPVVSDSLVVGGSTTITVADVQILRYKFGGGSPTAFADCEAVFVDSSSGISGETSGDIYLVTKWNTADLAKTRLFRYPNSKQDGTTTVELEMYSDSAVLQSETWTRADLARDGSLLALGGYGRTRFFTRNGTVSNTVAVNSCSKSNIPRPVNGSQYEALCLVPSGDVALEVSECGANPCNAVVSFTALARPTRSPTASAHNFPTAGSTSAAMAPVPGIWLVDFVLVVLIFKF